MGTKTLVNFILFLIIMGTSQSSNENSISTRAVGMQDAAVTNLTSSASAGRVRRVVDSELHV